MPEDFTEQFPPVLALALPLQNSHYQSKRKLYVKPHSLTRSTFHFAPCVHHSNLTTRTANVLQQPEALINLQLTSIHLDPPEEGYFVV